MGLFLGVYYPNTRGIKTGKSLDMTIRKSVTLPLNINLGLKFYFFEKDFQRVVHKLLNVSVVSTCLGLWIVETVSGVAPYSLPWAVIKQSRIE